MSKDQGHNYQQFQFEDINSFLEEYDKILIITTGSQGEKRAALTRIAANQHSKIDLEENDVVIFSSRIIPGNEISIVSLQNKLTRSKIKVLTEKDAFVHVSGHPSRDDLTKIYKWVKPNIVVPVHGEEIHLQGNVQNDSFL